MKCPKCGAWSRVRATHCECGHMLVDVGAPPGSAQRAGGPPRATGKRRVPAAHAGMAIAEFLSGTNRARGLTKEGKELPQLAKSPADPFILLQ